MTSRSILTLVAAAFLALAAAPLSAQENGAGTTREVVEIKLAEMKDRMALDDYQWSQVEMILKSSIRERVAIARRYGLDGDTVNLEELENADKKAMRRELKECGETAEKRMKRYLDKEQFKEFKAIQEEIHEELLARLEAI